MLPGLAAIPGGISRECENTLPNQGPQEEWVGG